MGNKRLNVFVNQCDVYRSVEFGHFPEIGNVYWDRPAPPELHKVDAILTGFRDVIDDSFLSSFPNVRIVGSNTTGVDHIRPNSRKIEVVHLQADDIETVSATAEFTLALLLALVRRFPFIDFRNLSDWTSECRGVQLKGKTIGIFGLGRLGTKVARYAEALGMIVMSFDKQSTMADKAHLLETCDVLSMHLPLNDETRNFIDYPDFALMKHKPFIVNTARPQIIRKEALVNALQTGKVSGAAMDFVNYDATRTVDPQLEPFTKSNLLLTPHMGGNTHESVAFTADVVVRKLVSSVRHGSAVL